MVHVGLQCILLCLIVIPILLATYQRLSQMQEADESLGTINLLNKHKTLSPFKLQSNIQASHDRHSNDGDTPGPVMYSRVRKDRTGAAIQDMLMAHAFAFSEGVPYGGACGDGTHDMNAKRLIDSLGLSDELRFSCPKTRRSGMILNQQDYYTKDTAIFTREWLTFVQSKVKYNPIRTVNEKTINMAVHIRRGDVNPCKYPNRYLPNLHYLNVIDNVIQDVTAKSSKGVNITIFSETESFEKWDDFRNRNLKVNVQDDLVLIWKEMINADILVMSKSSFSLVPALLSRGTVLYTPFWHKPLAHWRIVDTKTMDSTNLELQRLQKQQCLR